MKEIKDSKQLSLLLENALDDALEKVFTDIHFIDIDWLSNILAIFQMLVLKLNPSKMLNLKIVILSIASSTALKLQIAPFPDVNFIIGNPNKAVLLVTPI